MTQKVLKVGASSAVTIPKKSMEELGLKPGDPVEVKTDAKGRVIEIRPAKGLSREDMNIARLTQRFIERYRKDLEALARK